jgi:hypothetical protein
MASRAPCSTVRTGREVNMGKGKRIPLDELDVANLYIGNLDSKLSGEEGHDTAVGVADRLVYSVVSGGGEAINLGSRPNFLDKDEVRPVFPQQGGEAGQVS